MLVSLLQHERIQTTLAKGKELRRWADKIITLGKKGNLHARRQAFALLRNEGIVKKLFNEIAPRLKDREGGYTRIYKMGWRPGDGAPLSFVELATFSSSAQKKSPVKKAVAVLEKVAPKKKKKEEGKEKEKEKEKGKEKKERGEKKEEKKSKKVAKETPKEKKEKAKKKSTKEKSQG
jgi:large subunit ribosomal protein L17